MGFGRLLLRRLMDHDGFTLLLWFFAATSPLLLLLLRLKKPLYLNQPSVVISDCALELVLDRLESILEGDGTILAVNAKLIANFFEFIELDVRVSDLLQLEWVQLDHLVQVLHYGAVMVLVEFFGH